MHKLNVITLLNKNEMIDEHFGYKKLSLGTLRAYV